MFDMLLDTGLTWIISGVGDEKHTLVMSTKVRSETVTEPDAVVFDIKSSIADSASGITDSGSTITDSVPTTDSVSVSTGVGDVHRDWVLEQKGEDLDGYDGEVVSLETGLKVLVAPGEKAKVIVPLGRREALIKQAHETSQHQSWKKTLQALREGYVWKTMSSQASGCG